MGNHLLRAFKLEAFYAVSLKKGGRKVVGELEATMLRAIDQDGSFTQAARRLNLSYAYVWNTVAEIERSLNRKIVASERGGAKGGRATLTLDGRRLLQAYSELDSTVQRFLKGEVAVQTRAPYTPQGRPNLTFVGSHCVVVEKLLQRLHSQNAKMTYQMVNVGSWAGITAMMLREADVAGIHIFDEETSRYNEPLLTKYSLSQTCALVRGYRRQQCLMVKKGNPKRIRDIQDLLRKDVKVANRNLGSGTRMLLDRRLRALAKSKGIGFGSLTRRIIGYASEMMTHRQVAAAVASRRADVGVGLSSVATEMKLDFAPVAEECYDFLTEKRIRNPHLRAFFNVLASKRFQAEVEASTPGIRFSEQSGRILA